MPTNKLIAISVGMAMTLPMIAARNFFVPVFVIWFLVNLLRDIEKTGKLYPYRFDKKNNVMGGKLVVDDGHHFSVMVCWGF